MSLPFSSRPLASEGARNRGAGLRLFCLLAGVVLALVLVAALARFAPGVRKQPFDDGLQQRLRAEGPDVVAIGNSLLESRFEPELLNRLVAPTRVLVHAAPGTGTARWYLMLKNQVIPSGVRPRRVVFFFVGYDLTNPHHFVNEQTLPEIEADSHESEAFLERVLAEPAGGLRSELRLRARQWVPARRLRPLAEGFIDRAGLLSADLIAGPDDPKRRKRTINAIFDFRRLREQLGFREEREQRESLPFDAALARSFLPEILRLGREAGISLWFVECKPYKSAGFGVRTPEEARYAAALRAYIESQGGRLIDMERESFVLESHYKGGNHIAPRWRDYYTRAFVAHVPELFE